MAFRLLLIVSVGLILLFFYDISSQAQVHKEISRQATHEPNGPLKDIKSLSDCNQWMTYYYLYPEPNLTVKVIKFFSKEKVWNMDTAQAPLIAFFSQVFAQNPSKLHKWMEELHNLPAEDKKIIYLAMDSKSAGIESRKIDNSKSSDLVTHFECSTA